MMRILLVEDDKNLSLLIKMILEKTEDYEVTLAQDGQKGLRKALEESFDLILLDAMLPKMNGFHFFYEYRKEEKNKNTPIIFLSALSQEKEVQKFKELGTGFIPKPFELSELADTINKILENSKNAS